jgi:hypothetical protein
MPSARELLEQADALMRRNRARAIDTEIPELTEIVPAIVPPIVSSRPMALDDVPELTDAVEEIEIQSIVDIPEDVGEPSVWLGFDRGDPRAAGSATAGLAPPTIHGPPAHEGEPAQSVRPNDAITGAAPTSMPSVESAAPAASAAPAEDWARWQALADEIRMEVLQRIDVYTDAGFRGQLGAHLQPIVDRASAQMVATINEQVGVLLRAHIAEVIEREIESRRNGGG